MKLFTRRILLFLLFFLGYSVSGQASLSITADGTSGCSPLVVHFVGAGGNPGDSYSWNFGTGTTSILYPDASTSFTTPGTYTVTLTDVTTGATATISVTVYPSPVIHFTASDTAICPGTPITFTSTTTAGATGALTLTWDFGDGTTGTGNPVTHTYTSSGYYNVTLSATNSNGCTSSLTYFSYIHVYTPAVPNFSVNSTYFCHAPGHAIFTNLTSGTPGFTYVWNFGDGSPTSTLADPTHDYTTPGSYTVTLVVTDGNGCKDSIVRPAYIFVGDLTAGFTFPSPACVYSAVIFTNTSSSHITSNWTYGDGGTGTGDPGIHTYTAPGTYTVTLVVCDGFCCDTISHTITIIPGPTASFTISPAEPCPPFSLTFAAGVPGGTIVTWLYGDGTTGGGTASSHTYGISGVDTIKMIATSGTTGCKDTVTQVQILYNMIFNATATPLAGCNPLTTTFSTMLTTTEPDSISHLYPWPITSYVWNFGDGSGVSTSGTPTHTYTAVGVYYAVVTGTTSNGCTVSDTVKILVGVPPQVTFTATPTHQCYRNNLVIATSTIVVGPVSLYDWLWGDGTGDIDSSGIGVHNYTLPGAYIITVIPSYNGCEGPPYTFTDSIIIDSPKAIIENTILCSPHTRVDFGDSSVGDNTHLWIFGDGTTSTLNDPVHDYPGLLSYIVTLTTYNAASGCRDTATKEIDLEKPVPHFTAVDTAICRDSLVVFTATLTGDSVAGYVWHSPGGISADSFSVTLIDTFHTTGIYPVTLVIEDENGCLDTVTRNNYIHVAKPVASFTASPPTGCAPLSVTFTNTSTDIAGTSYTHYTWAFGDGDTTNVTTSPTTHIYTVAGVFTTEVIVTDNIGCKDTVSLSLVTAYKPHAAMLASTTYPCIGASVTFNNTSVGITTSYWFFGDGDTSTLVSPTHTYTAAGAYTVKLVVADSHGCTDTAVYSGYINVTKPVAAFHMDDSFSICPPLTVHFFNTSTGAIAYHWTLGDGSSSASVNPTDLYIAVGLYDVMLVATNLYGCSDTATGHVNIYGYAGAFSYAPLSGCSPLTVNFHASISNVPTIIWDFSDGVTTTASLVDSTSHTYTVPGAYIPKLILSDNTGCESSSLGLDTIKVDGVMPGFTTIPNPVCLGAAFNFDDTSKSYWSTISSWNWLFDGATSGISAPSFTLNTIGTFPATLQVTDGWGCTANVTEDVTVYPPPVITVSPDTIICVGDAATLRGFGGVSYTWAPADGTLSCTACNPAMASPVVITNYTVTGTDQHGCSNTDTVSVFLKTQTVSVAYRDTEICLGVIVQLLDSGATKFTWTPAAGLSNAHIADPLASPAVTTLYKVVAQLASCFPDSNYVTIIVHPLPTVVAGPDQTVLEGTPAQLSATGTLIDKYWWYPPNTLSCDSCPNPVATMSLTTTYLVTVATTFGCESSDSVKVFIFCDKSQVFIPNSFTPNGDGQNDVFYPRGRGISIIKSFRIYNRWGQMLFERSDININDASNAWDGSYMGSTPKPDVYVYIIDAICETGAPINLKGDVTIIR